MNSISIFFPDSQECIQRQDVVVVYELAYNAPNQFEKVLQELTWSLKLKNHDCIRLGVILVWKKVDTLIPLSCTYGDAPCYKTVFNIIKEQAKQQASSGSLDLSYDKSNLASAIETAYKMLSSRKFSKEVSAPPPPPQCILSQEKNRLALNLFKSSEKYLAPQSLLCTVFLHGRNRVNSKRGFQKLLGRGGLAVYHFCDRNFD